MTLGWDLPPVVRRWASVSRAVTDGGICYRRCIEPAVWVVTGPAAGNDAAPGDRRADLGQGGPRETPDPLVARTWPAPRWPMDGAVEVLQHTLDAIDRRAAQGDPAGVHPSHHGPVQDHRVHRAARRNQHLAEQANAAFEDAFDGAVDRGEDRAIPGAESCLTLSGTQACGCVSPPASPGRPRPHRRHAGWEGLVEAVLSPATTSRGQPWPDMVLTAVLRLRIDDVAEVAVVENLQRPAGRAHAGHRWSSASSAARSRSELSRAPPYPPHRLGGRPSRPAARPEPAGTPTPRVTRLGQRHLTEAGRQASLHRRPPRPGRHPAPGQRHSSLADATVELPSAGCRRASVSSLRMRHCMRRWAANHPRSTAPSSDAVVQWPGSALRSNRSGGRTAASAANCTYFTSDPRTTSRAQWAMGRAKKRSAAGWPGWRKFQLQWASVRQCCGAHRPAPSRSRPR